MKQGPEQHNTPTLFTERITRVVNIGYRASFDADPPPFDVFIGRKRYGYSGYFGNPFRIKKPCPICRRPMDREAVIWAFEKYARQRILLDPRFRGFVKRLHGKILG